LLETLPGELAATNTTVLEREGPKRAKQEKVAIKMDGLENVQPDDFLSVYLSEVAQEPLLTHAQEIELAQQIERGRKAEQAIKNVRCAADEYAQLQARVQAGQAARERLGWANTRLVISIAKRYRGNGVSFLDLIQNGNVGLMRAVDRYDYRTGNRFATYATWWVRQAIIRSLANQGRIIRIPIYMGDRIRKMLQVSQRIEKEHGRPATLEEIAAEIQSSPTKVRQMLRWASRPLSLEQPAGKEGDVELGHFVKDQRASHPEEMAESHLLGERLGALLDNLTAREARVLRLRHGLQDGQTRTLREVAEKFGLSRERIRQIEQEALDKLREIAPRHRLKHFL
jgi:RNA polymerase primary sigma factor